MTAQVVGAVGIDFCECVSLFCYTLSLETDTLYKEFGVCPVTPQSKAASVWAVEGILEFSHLGSRCD